jgi:hypothetical protein
MLCFGPLIKSGAAADGRSHRGTSLAQALRSGAGSGGAGGGNCVDVATGHGAQARASGGAWLRQAKP